MGASVPASGGRCQVLDSQNATPGSRGRDPVDWRARLPPFRPGFTAAPRTRHDRPPPTRHCPPPRPSRRRGKLFIETHGCQMNEYDSAKMADVLAASDGLELTTNVEEADVILVNTCSIREKAQEKVFSQLGRWKALKKGGRPVLIGVGGCVASPGRRGDRQARALRGPGVRPADPAPPARADPRQARDRPAAGRHQLPRDREVRPPARTARRRPQRLRVDHGRLHASTAASAWCPTPAARKSAGRSRTCWSRSRSWPRRACARSTCSARTSTPTAGRDGAVRRREGRPGWPVPTSAC